MTDKNLVNEETLKDVTGGAGKATYTCAHCMQSFPKTKVVYIASAGYYLCRSCKHEMDANK